MAQESAQPTPITQSRELSNETRNAILQQLLKNVNSITNKLKWGAVKDIASSFKVNRMTVSRIWKRASDCYRGGKLCADVNSKKRKLREKTQGLLQSIEQYAECSYESEIYHKEFIVCRWGSANHIVQNIARGEHN